MVFVRIIVIIVLPVFLKVHYLSSSRYNYHCFCLSLFQMFHINCPPKALLESIQYCICFSLKGTQEVLMCLRRFPTPFLSNICPHPPANYDVVSLAPLLVTA